MDTPRIQVFDDDPSRRVLLEQTLAREEWRVTGVGTARDALSRLAIEPPPDLLVGRAEAGGMELLEAFRAQAPDTPVILVTDSCSIADAVEAIRRGAFDYLSSACAAEAVPIAAHRALRQRALVLENRALRRDLSDKYRLQDVIGSSEAMLEVFKTAARVAATAAAVLLVGERGSGRERVARAIHQASPRSGGPFVAIDCATLPEAVLEPELFGNARAANGVIQKRGLLEEARGGTLYLGSVGRLAPSLQTRLLYTLEGRAASVPAHPKERSLDIRVVTSTDEDLRALTREGRFREDLLYRLEVVSISIPPLRGRREDVPLLAEHFAAKHGRAPVVVSPAAMELLLAYDWPGNVRELENAIARALALSSAAVVLPENLPPAVRGARPHPVPTGAPGARPSLAELERRYAHEVLRETGGNKTRAAEILGIDRKTLYRLLGDASANGPPHQSGRCRASTAALDPRPST